MAVEESGFYYPNKMVRIYVNAIEETLGPEATKKVLELADIPANYYPPPNNFAKEIDFAHYAAIGTAIETMYGHRGERGIGVHAAKASFTSGLAEFGSIIGMSDLVFKTIPLQAKLKIGLKGMATSFAKFSDQVTDVSETDDYFIYTIHRCPICWGRTSSRPICYVAGGMILEGLRWASDGREFHIEEVACHAMGDESCVFYIMKEPID